jgi:hypothetical protein
MASDRRIQLTVVLLGVAEDIATLLSSHASVERCLHQIQMPRMSADETRAIIETGWRDAGFEYVNTSADVLVQWTMGLPYYAHLLGQQAGFQAADVDQLLITEEIARASVRRASQKVEYTIAASYRDACERADA